MQRHYLYAHVVEQSVGDSNFQSYFTICGRYHCDQPHHHLAARKPHDDHYFGHLPDYWKAHGFPQATNGTTFEGEPSDASNVDSNGATVTAYNLQSACTENPSPSWNE